MENENHLFFPKIVSFSTCGIYKSCSKYFETNPTYTNFKSLGTWSYTLTVGYNKLKIDSSKSFPIGSIVVATAGQLIAVDTSENCLYSDYIVSGTNLVQLNKTRKWRFYLNVLIDVGYYESVINIDKTYSVLGSYNLTAGINGSDVVYYETAIINNSTDIFSDLQDVIKKVDYFLLKRFKFGFKLSKYND